jgi:2-polyprenyl-3-methyl-5-hydroxy-6-metoxy-1,4-benzoquinol methylase
MTLDALAQQSVKGFRTIVVVDGEDQDVPTLDSVELVVQERGGPGVARNRGVREADTPLIIFLGDDMIPQREFVEAHLDGHRADPSAEAAILGHSDWHPSLGDQRLLNWMDWSATQFNYLGLAAGDDAHWTRFYSSNVSLKRDLFLSVDGFDEQFFFAYEDLDIAKRLGERGLRLTYTPAALTHHMHPYSWDGVVSRFAGVALGERVMKSKHADFEPFFLSRAHEASRANVRSPLWPLLADRVPERMPGLREAVRERANHWYYGRLAHDFIHEWHAVDELEELREYLGDEFDRDLLWKHESETEREEHEAPDEETFYRTSRMYLYDLTVFAMSPTKLPYHRLLERLVPPGSRVLDYGCGIGSDGLRLIDRGYDVEFADFDNPSTRYLRHRLKQRDIDPPVHDVDKDVPDGFDAVYCFDVIEHVQDPFGFLARLEELADLVVINFVAPAPNDTHLHHDLDIPALLAHVMRRGLVAYERHHGRVHLVAYRPRSDISLWRGRATRQFGRVRSKVRDLRKAVVAATADGNLKPRLKKLIPQSLQRPR